MVEELLKELADDKVLNCKCADPVPVCSSPVCELLSSYTKLTKKDADLPAPESDWNGRDLKDALSVAEPKDVIPMLYTYQQASINSTPSYDYEAPAVRDTRLHKQWISKALIITACIMLLVVAGAVIALGVMTGNLTNGPFVDTVLTAAMEIIRIVFMPAGGGI